MHFWPKQTFIQRFPKYVNPNKSPKEDARARADGYSVEDEPTEAEIKAGREVIPAIERVCRFVGMGFTEYDHAMANRLLGEYAAEDIAKAVTIAAKRGRDQRNWGFIEGILKRGVDTPKPTPQKVPVREVAQHRYSQRTYTKEEDEALFANIFDDNIFAENISV